MKSEGSKPKSTVRVQAAMRGLPRRTGTMTFIKAEDASKIAGLLFTLRAGGVPTDQRIKALQPGGAFAKDVAKAIVFEFRSSVSKVRQTRSARAGAREVAVELLHLSRRPRKGSTSPP